MPAVHLDRVAFRYSSAAEVLTDVSVHVGDGWTGVVGANGAGKSTLLSLMAGSLVPTRGMVSLDPADAIVGRCPQEVDEPTRAITALASSYDGSARKWMGRLDLVPEALERWPSLSPGERKRWQIGAALAGRPDILFLDEPTNHLDERAKEMVVMALQRFSGTGLVVSHDRAFLDSLTSRTLRLAGGRVELWAAPYSASRREWLADQELQARRYDEAKRKETAVRRRLADERRDAASRSARFRRTMRNAEPSDHDATSLAAKGRHAGGKAAGARRRSGTRAELGRAEEARRELAPMESVGGDIFFDYEPAPKARLLAYTGSLTAGGREIAPRVDVVVERGARVRLTGPNGAGKSTLLGTLVSSSRFPDQKLLHLPQELTREEGTGLLHRLADLSNERRGRVLSVVAALGVDPETLLSSLRPSPGEARKLALALGLGTNTWCLLLDEPTNHLDVEAVERVEAALEGYPGAVILTTHDARFATATTTATWHLEGGVLTADRGNKSVRSLPEGAT